MSRKEAGLGTRLSHGFSSMPRAILRLQDFPDWVVDAYLVFSLMPDVGNITYRFGSNDCECAIEWCAEVAVVLCWQTQVVPHLP